MADSKNAPNVATSAIPVERSQFLFKLLSNPNYFGNLVEHAANPVKIIKEDTTYEELKCVGYDPELSQLEAVVWIKRPGGYDGDICTNGSQEYVSFFLSYDNGASWLPQGTVHFTVYDVAGPHPLEYAVHLPIHPDRKLCFFSNMPLVRAILSWNVAPSGPNAFPVWGNRVQAHIQIPGFFLEAPLPVVLEAAKIALPSELSALVATDATIKLAAPKPLSAAELRDQYAKSGVPAHRFLKAQIDAISGNSTYFLKAGTYLNGLGVDIEAAIAALAATNGDTAYEQLQCIGLEEGDGAPDALIGTIQIKLPTGYLGSPCFSGSREYVAFWIDWGSGWHYVGTASTNVHDIGAIPKDGLSYAVYLPVNLNAHRKSCIHGPVTARVRAILSWDSPPPPANPNFVPVWGNRLETNILVNPGVSEKAGDYTPYLSSVCGVDPCNIDQSSGWANPGAGDQPFGGSISIFGSIPGTPLFSASPTDLPLYQVTVQRLTPTVGPVQYLFDPFTVTIQSQVGAAAPTSHQQTQSGSGGYFTYRQMTPNPGVGWNIVSPQGLLAVWNSASFPEGIYRISVIARNAATNTNYLAGSFVCANGPSLASVVIDLDEAAPVADLEITGYMPGGVGPCIPAANCQTFTVGDVICGSYAVSDAHIGSFSLQAEPTPSPTSGFSVDGAPNSNGESYPAIPVTTTSKSGVWTYNTAGLPPCGYTIQLFTGDRTIVDCDTNWENNGKFVGFCLVAETNK